MEDVYFYVLVNREDGSLGNKPGILRHQMLTKTNDHQTPRDRRGLEEELLTLLESDSPVNDCIRIERDTNPP